MSGAEFKLYVFPLSFKKYPVLYVWGDVTATHYLLLQ